MQRALSVKRTISDTIPDANVDAKRSCSAESVSSPTVVSSSNGGSLLRRVSVEKSAFAINPMSVINERVVIAMVGLPARGKSYTSKAIMHYLAFLGCPVRLFNAGNTRRSMGLAGADASFFDASNEGAKHQRDQMAMATLDELLAWLETVPSPSCACGIFDATNTTVARRHAVIERCAQAERASASALRLVFVENVCNDEALLLHSYQMKLGNGDYKGADPEQALADFISRVRAYERVYETISDMEAQVRMPARSGGGGDAALASRGSPQMGCGVVGWSWGRSEWHVCACTRVHGVCVCICACDVCGRSPARGAEMAPWCAYAQNVDGTIAALSQAAPLPPPHPAFCGTSPHPAFYSTCPPTLPSTACAPFRASSPSMTLTAVG